VSLISPAVRPPVIAIALVVAVLAVLGGVAIGADRDARSDVEPRTPASITGSAHAFDVERIAEGFNRPTWVGPAPGDSRALWVLEQPGRLIRLTGERREVRLDLSREVDGSWRARSCVAVRDRPDMPWE
jgi:hypothetical protein